jgi:1-deoxy-D-xylulose-5-phosphate reductoisomerase
MRIPIAYALSAPERVDMGLPRLDLPSVNNLTFLEPDMDKFPCLRLAYAACKQGGTLPVVLNAANEVAVDAFLEGRIRFTDIARAVEGTMYGSEASAVNSLEDIMAADHLARIQAGEEVEKFKAQSSNE